MHFNTFYGGGDPTWYPNDLNWADFKNFAFDDYSASTLPSDIDNCPTVQFLILISSSSLERAVLRALEVITTYK